MVLPRVAEREGGRSVKNAGDVVDVADIVELIRYASCAEADNGNTTEQPYCAAPRQFEERQDEPERDNIAEFTDEIDTKGARRVTRFGATTASRDNSGGKTC